MVIKKVPSDLHKGLSVAHSEYTGRGRRDVAKSWAAHVTVHDPENSILLDISEHQDGKKPGIDSMMDQRRLVSAS